MNRHAMSILNYSLSLNFRLVLFSSMLSSIIFLRGEEFLLNNSELEFVFSNNLLTIFSFSQQKKKIYISFPIVCHLAGPNQLLNLFKRVNVLFTFVAITCQSKFISLRTFHGFFFFCRIESGTLHREYRASGSSIFSTSTLLCPSEWIGVLMAEAWVRKH